jgi:hypothetical protein
MLASAGVQVAHRSFYGEWRDLATADRSELLAILRSVDAVVVNGEGTIHHGRGRHLLTILRTAQVLGLPTVLVNAVLQACDGDRGVLERLTDCTVRDAASSDYLTALGVPHRVVFDSILEAEFIAAARLDLAGKVVVTDWHGSRVDVGTALQHVQAEIGDGAVWYPLEHPEQAAHWAHALADLQAARLVVTGRYHGVCLAAMAGVPFVACGSNTWKVEGLLAWLPGELQAWRPGADLMAMCLNALQRPAVFAEIQRWVLAQRPLQTFAGLAA